MKTCLHSVSYSGSWGQARLSLEETVDKTADLGFDAIMLMAKRPHGSLLDMPRQRRREVKARLADRGIECACIAGYTNFTADAGHPEIPMVEMQVDYVSRLAELARDLNCGLVRIFTGYETDALSFGHAWQRCVEAVRECCERAAQFGVTIGVQNHHDIAAGYKALREFIAAVNRPNCGACFDAWAPTLHGDDIVAAAAAMAHITVHTTVADYIRLPRYRYEPEQVNYTPLTSSVLAVPVGDGIIDYRAFLETLKANGYDGYVGYEMCSPLRGGGDEENLDRSARRFLEFMRAFT